MISACFQWLITYLLHSSVLLGCAALLDWRRRLTARGLSSPLWRIALFGGFLSASLQPALQGRMADSGLPAGIAAQHLFTERSFLALPPLHAVAIDIAPLLVPAWLGLAFCGIAYLLARLVRLTRATRRLPGASSPALECSARELALRARISMPQLRMGTHLQAPLVAPGRVVLIPGWMLDHYEWPRLKAALAHEIAHLRRHDNEWRIASRIAAMLGWLQPLNRIAVRRLDESAELACDHWAATTTGLRRELAHGLEDCASRIGSSPHDQALTIGMAATRFTLLERVTQLLEDSQMNTGLKRAARWSSATLLVIAVAGSLLVVTTLDDDVPPRWLAANGLYQSLRNIGQDAHRSRSVVVKTPEHFVYVRVTEDFSIDPPSPAHGRAGMAVIAETRAGVTRSVRYERDNSSKLRLTYKVDGHVQTLDAEGERWLETMMQYAAPAFSRT